MYSGLKSPQQAVKPFTSAKVVEKPSKQKRPVVYFATMVIENALQQKNT